MSTRERIAIGALIGAVTGAVVSSLAVEGLSLARTAGCVLFAALGAVVYLRSPKVSWACLAAVLTAWCIVAFTPLARRWSTGLVRRDRIPQSVDAVVVLSGSVSRDGMLGREALDRLLAGLRFIRAGTSRTLVITQPHPWANRSITTAADQRRIIALVQPEPFVVIIDGVVSTRTEALGTARLIPPSITRTIAVVTSPLHTRRACKVFEHVGYRVVCVPAQSRDIALLTLATASDRLAAFRMVAYERLAFVVYRYHGWL